VTFVPSVVKAFNFNFGETESSVEIRAAYPSRFLSGTHKNLQRLVIYPIYSVVNIVLTEAVVGRQSSVVSQKPKTNHYLRSPRLSGYGSY